MSSPALAAVARNPARDYLELAKLRITGMVTLTAWVGFVLAGGEGIGLLTATLLGTALVAAGASTLNMVLERHTDALMRRTQDRPLPAGRLRPEAAVAFGLLVTSTGLLLLTTLAHSAAALVALVTWTSYVFVYTPLKTRTSLATVVGAVPGALPPLIGWAAARGQLDAEAFPLFAILFLWQIPHFLAIAWLYRDDYAAAGLPMLPVIDRDGRLTGRQAVANCVALMIASLAPLAAGLAGPAYGVGALVFGLWMTAAAVRTARERTLTAARGLFLASLAYLPGVFGLLVAFRS
jgi:protoheme IX farnesyltransferase